MKTDQIPLFPADGQAKEILSFCSPSSTADMRAIEHPSFPFDKLSEIAEAESWRKEVTRPIYHIHKWWAQRLGSVFRAIIIATFAPSDSDILQLFYSPVRLPRVVVFDPFMGSGTTIGETLKLGGRAIGRDINPVAHFVVKNALRMPRAPELMETFKSIERDVAPRIRRYYQAQLPDGKKADVLYYFWVKQIACPRCRELVNLFPTYVFARHAYPEQYPIARAVCPMCGEINRVRYDANETKCGSCREVFNPLQGPTHGAKATCRCCGGTFRIAEEARKAGNPPAHSLSAKLVLTPNGEKIYLRSDSFDNALFNRATRDLGALVKAYPVVPISPGYNTNQVLNYSYKYWHEMFNARQLLGLSILFDRIKQIPDQRQRELFCCLLSGALEFNNMFASYKGEGTGAVRHMFYHHILKPERTPLEANIWGTPKSSGSFSTLFATRVLRAVEYSEDPFELRIERKNGGTGTTKKVFGLSSPISAKGASRFADFEKGMSLYLSCGDSGHTDLRSRSVDAVITDPPFFDNVHYSQLADFFYVWQRHFLEERGPYVSPTTRAEFEVQQCHPLQFTEHLTRVWKECHRVLRGEGILVFTYHHSRPEGWSCLLQSLLDAGFTASCVHPIKSEMSVATPKHQAREPIDLDMVFACRKRGVNRDIGPPNLDGIVQEVTREAKAQVIRLRSCGRPTSPGDIRVILMAQLVVRLSRVSESSTALRQFDLVRTAVENTATHLCEAVRFDETTSS